MKTAFFQRMALNGISKNRKMYIPYLISSIAMVMMQYLICFLSSDPEISLIKGGMQMQMILSIGVPIVVTFSIVFLFYTSTFLMRRRKKEFGLYNMLGMEKRNLSKILFWETLVIAGISIGLGLFCGIAFSKLTQLVLANALGSKVGFTLNVELSPVLITTVVFAVIFFLVYLVALRQIHLSSPVELLKSENVGEKPPKSNPILAIIGLILLSIGYYLAITIQDPMAALMVFFLAVILVMLGTYLLFISGSVALCKLFKKNKKYYYNKKHFVSISSMSYRMKRNGAGLGSICLLCTAVLVMLSSTSCLIIGSEDMLVARYPRDINVNIYSRYNQPPADAFTAFDKVLKENNSSKENVVNYQFFELSGMLFEKTFTSANNSAEWDFMSSSDFLFIPISDYNAITGENITLEQNEIVIGTTKQDYPHDTLIIESYGEVKVKQIIKDNLPNRSAAMSLIPIYYVYANDIAQIASAFSGNISPDSQQLNISSNYYCFDVKTNESDKPATLLKIYDEFIEASKSTALADFDIAIDSQEIERGEFLSLYGGLFCLAILLGIICVGAAVLIMYYKQVTEGYEDKERFEIMQKVGMTKKEISQSINSQVLTVFFAPLLVSGIHILAAFHIIFLLLTVFGLSDLPLLIFITLGCYAIFALLYSAVYFITSKAYYNIVSKPE